MRRLTFLTLVIVMPLTLVSCKQTADDRYQNYLEEMADTAGFEYITPEKDSIEYVEDDGYNPLDDGGGIVTIPDIPQERNVNMNGNNYEVEKMMMGRE